MNHAYMPSEPIETGGPLRIAPPAPAVVATMYAVAGDVGRLATAYGAVCQLLAEARLLIAKTLPDNWQDHPDMVDAVEWLGGPDEFESLQACEDPVEAKLP